MPRRNRTTSRGARRRSVAPPSLTAPTSDISTDRMALELVRTGKASAAILGSYLPPKPRTTDERNHA